MPLTNIQVDKSKAKEKDYRLTDGKGLYLLVKKSGSKYWRYDYTIHGNRKTLALGVYPTTSLKQAREAHQTARTLKAQGIDPSQQKRKDKLLGEGKANNTLERVAKQWHERKSHEWTEDYAKDVWRSLEMHVLPSLGKTPITEIDTPMLVKVFSVVENKGSLETARRLRQRCSDIFGYGIASGICESDPAKYLKNVLKKPKVKHHPALELHEMPAYLAAIENCNMTMQTRLAIKLATLTFLRNSELRETTWDEIDFENEVWVKPITKMKRKNEETHTDLVIPLARQTVQILRQLQTLNGNSPYLFPQARNPKKPMSDGAIAAVINRIGYRGRMTVHGYRTVACSALNESGKFPADAIELQLHHMDKNTTRGIYNRKAGYYAQRYEMMQWWADKVDALTRGADVIYPQFGTQL